MRTMKRYMKIAALAATLFGIVTSCQEPLVDGFDAPVQDGYVNVSFNAEIPDMGEVVTKVVDPDGEDISTMSLLCFNEQGLFLATVQATLNSNTAAHPSVSGSYTAAIPETTDRIHFLANQNMSLFDESEFVGKTESEVISAMEGSSGMMIYWARVAKSDVKIDGKAASTILLALQNIVVPKVVYKEDGTQQTPENDPNYLKGTVVLTRNHARVGVRVNATTGSGTSVFTVDGFAVVNTSAFGTVAPYSPSGKWEAPQLPKSMRFVTLPENRSVLSDIQDVTTQEWQYVFETENTSENPVSVIIKGKNAGETESKYYRVMLIDTANDFIPVMRNFNYCVYIMGALEYGQNTFEDALTAPATNNVWLSVSDNVKEVRSTDYALAVDETYVVIGQNDPVWNSQLKKYTLKYSVEKLGSGSVAATDKPEVSWLEGNTVAQNAITNTFTVTGTPTKVEGTLEIVLNPLQEGEIMREGTILVKLGPLQRKIKVISINTMKFIPSWVSTEVYSTTAGANMTMMFTIPENCPAELFPFDVLVSVNDLDVRAASGQSLPIIRRGQEGYDPDGVADTNDNGYKYVYTVTGPGVQRLYFDSILNQDGGSSGKITIEAAHFEPLTKTYTFSANNLSINFSENATNPLLKYSLGYQVQDEYIYYMLVPQKKYANVRFDLILKNGRTYTPSGDIATDGTSVDAGANDEFLLYSSNLDYWPSAKTYYDRFGVEGFDCTFYRYGMGDWGTGGRVHMFKPDNVNADPDGTYSIYLYTTKPKSEEVIRVASNNKNSVSGLPTNGGALYTGNTYRSITFELANYRPFEFASTLNNGNTGEDLYLAYEPGRPVNVSFDIKSFTATNNSEVDPFGTAFKVFIDAPMLQIDTESELYRAFDGKTETITTYEYDASGDFDTTEESFDKFYYDEEIEKFVYVVSASKAEEDTYGTNGRKTLPFKTKPTQIVTAGEITISADPEMITYNTNKFKVYNNSITGEMKYGADVASATNDVPTSAFVPMERVSDNTRIGSVSVNSNGQYELRLRGEYNFNWYSDKIQFEYLASDGNTYRAEVASLDALYNNPSIVLLPETN